MNDAEDQLRREVALFRYGLIADLIHLPPGTPGIGDKLRAKAEQQYTIPGTLRTRVAAETLRDWLLHYRRGGFDALYPKPRADRGRPRRLPAEVAELLLSIKAEHPSWSVRQVIAGAVASGHLPDGVRPAHSTVHRLLRAEGLMSKPTATSDGTDRRRFSYRSAGQLWMSDVMHGPTVGDGNRRRKSYLISFLDDATRVSPFSAFALADNRRLWAYIEGEYHQQPHRGLHGNTPLDQWAMAAGEVRYLDASDDLDEVFLFEVKRRVMNDRTVSLNGRLYEVDALLVGQTVTLRYDPGVPPTRPLQVRHNGADAGLATILDAYANASVKRARPSWQIESDAPTPQPPPSPLALHKLDHSKESD